MKIKLQVWKMTDFPPTPLFFLSISLCPICPCIVINSGGHVHGISKRWPNRFYWKHDFLYVHIQGTNTIENIPSIQGNWASHNFLNGALERMKCELLELHLLILMNLGDLLSFTEENFVRKKNPLVSSHAVNTAWYSSSIKGAGPVAKPVSHLNWDK